MRRITIARLTLLRRASVLAAIAVLSTVGLSLAAAAPAGAALTICKAGATCTPGTGGCSLLTTGGSTLLFDNGDSFDVKRADGTTAHYTCKDGVWYLARAAGLSLGIRGPVLGRGQAEQGPPSDTACTSETLLTCIPGITITLADNTPPPTLTP